MITSGVSSNLNWVSHEFPFIITRLMAKTKFVSRIYETYIFNFSEIGAAKEDVIKVAPACLAKKNLLRAGTWKSDKSLNRP